MKACRAALSRFDGDGHRLALLAAAAAATKGQWEEAWARLQEAGMTEQAAEFYAAAAFQSGETGALKAKQDAFALYYRAADTLRDRKLEEADGILNRIDPEHSIGEAARRLRGWIRAQEFLDLQRAGRVHEAASSLDNAIAFWPDPDGPIGLLDGTNLSIIPALVAGGSRDGLGHLLRNRAASNGLGNPMDNHLLGLCCLSNGCLRRQADSIQEAIEYWRSAIAFLAVPLSDLAYLRTWSLARARVYGTDPDGLDLRRDTA